MSVRVDGRDLDGRIWIVMVANAERVSGNCIGIAPGARVATGDHVKEPGVSCLPGKMVEISSRPCAILDLDGDIYGTTPASFTVCPQALRVLTPK